MTDRLTQLQDAVNQLGESFCNSVGILQSTPEQSQTPPTGPQQNAESKESTEDNIAVFTSLIVRTAQDIEILITSLPNQDKTQESEVEALRKLEAENKQAALKLQQAVEEGEALLAKIRDAIKLISNSQLGMDDTQQNQDDPPLPILFPNQQ